MVILDTQRIIIADKDKKDFSARNKEIEEAFHRTDVSVPGSGAIVSVTQGKKSAGGNSSSQQQITTIQEFQANLLKNQGYNVEITSEGQVKATKGDQQLVITPEGNYVKAPISASIGSSRSINETVQKINIASQQPTTSQEVQVSLLKKQGYTVTILPDQQIKAIKGNEQLVITPEGNYVKVPSSAIVGTSEQIGQLISGKRIIQQRPEEQETATFNDVLEPLQEKVKKQLEIREKQLNYVGYELAKAREKGEPEKLKEIGFAVAETVFYGFQKPYMPLLVNPKAGIVGTIKFGLEIIDISPVEQTQKQLAESKPILTGLEKEFEENPLGTSLSLAGTFLIFKGIEKGVTGFKPKLLEGFEEIEIPITKTVAKIDLTKAQISIGNVNDMIDLISKSKIHSAKLTESDILLSKLSSGVEVKPRSVSFIDIVKESSPITFEKVLATRKVLIPKEDIGYWKEIGQKEAVFSSESLPFKYPQETSIILKHVAGVSEAFIRQEKVTVDFNQEIKLLKGTENININIIGTKRLTPTEEPNIFATTMDFNLKIGGDISKQLTGEGLGNVKVEDKSIKGIESIFIDNKEYLQTFKGVSIGKINELDISLARVATKEIKNYNDLFNKRAESISLFLEKETLKIQEGDFFMIRSELIGIEKSPVFFKFKEKDFEFVPPEETSKGAINTNIIQQTKLIKKYGIDIKDIALDIISKEKIKGKGWQESIGNLDNEIRQVTEKSKINTMQFLKEKTKIKVEDILGVKQLPKIKIGTESKQESKQKNKGEMIFDTSIVNENIIKSKNKEFLKNFFIGKEELISETKQEQRNKQSSIPIFKLAEETKQETKQETISKLVSMISLKIDKFNQIAMLNFDTDINIHKLPEEEPPTNLSLKFKFNKEPERKAKKKILGFDVFIKSKRLKLGKGRYVDIGYTKLNLEPLTKAGAKVLGIEAISKSAARTFILKPSANEGQSYKDYQLPELEKKIQPSKSIMGGLVQKARYAISSMQEKAEIPGEAQRQRKKEGFKFKL